MKLTLLIMPVVHAAKLAEITIGFCHLSPASTDHCQIHLVLRTLMTHETTSRLKDADTAVIKSLNVTEPDAPHRRVAVEAGPWSSSYIIHMSTVPAKRSSSPSVNQNKQQKMSDSVTAPPAQLLIKKLGPKARSPTRGSRLAAGYDLYRWARVEERVKGGPLLILCVTAPRPRQFQPGEKHLSIPSSLSRSPSAPTAVWLLGPVWVRRLRCWRIKGFRADTHLCRHTASKHMIDTGAGVIDADYRGTVFVLLFNHAETDFTGGSWTVLRHTSRHPDRQRPQ